MNISTKVS